MKNNVKKNVVYLLYDSVTFFLRVYHFNDEKTCTYDNMSLLI